jgi:hypothetical protein
VGRPSAATRLVPLRALLQERSWPPADELLRRFASYGRSHGAWDDTEGYAEGILARVIEAAAGVVPRLPSVKSEPGFLCGTEFASADEEEMFLAGLGVDVDAVATNVVLAPGEVLVFDNLGNAHGRRGVRAPDELQQWVFGHPAMPVLDQRALRDRFLRFFETVPPHAGDVSRRRQVVQNAEA